MDNKEDIIKEVVKDNIINKWKDKEQIKIEINNTKTETTEITNPIGNNKTMDKVKTKEWTNKITWIKTEEECKITICNNRWETNNKWWVSNNKTKEWLKAKIEICHNNKEHLSNKCLNKNKCLLILNKCVHNNNRYSNSNVHNRINNNNKQDYQFKLHK